jgi:hypothetical protein
MNSPLASLSLELSIGLSSLNFPQLTLATRLLLDHYRQQGLGYVSMPMLTMFLDEEQALGSLSAEAVTERCLGVMAALCQNDAVAVRALSFHHQHLSDRLLELAEGQPNAVASLVAALSKPDENRLVFTSAAWLAVLHRWADVPDNAELVASTACVLHHLAQHHHRKKNELSRMDVQRILQLCQRLLHNLSAMSDVRACCDADVPALTDSYQHLAGVLLALSQHRHIDSATLLDYGILHQVEQLLLDRSPWEASLAQTLALLSEERMSQLAVAQSKTGVME